MIGTVKSITVSSRASVKIKDSFYTFEYSEERSVPEDLSENDYKLAQQEIWDTCNAQVDEQIEEIVKMLR